MDPNSAILGDVTYFAPVHQLVPMPLIREIQIGSNLTVYGQIRKQVDGEMRYEYIHLRGGSYTFEEPLQFTTFHATLLNL